VLRGKLPQQIELYGTGCIGVDGIPRVRHQSSPVLGADTFALAFERGRAFSAGIFLLAFNSAAVVLPGGCLLHVQDFLELLAVPSDGTGFGFLPLPIPEDLSLVGGSFFGQWFVLDAAGGLLGALSATGGVRVRMGG
jgi:hypothetical protein